jgi:hypothetical protein
MKLATHIETGPRPWHHAGTGTHAAARAGAHRLAEGRAMRGGVDNSYPGFYATHAEWRNTLQRLAKRIEVASGQPIDPRDLLAFRWTTRPVAEATKQKIAAAITADPTIGEAIGALPPPNSNIANR